MVKEVKHVNRGEPLSDALRALPDPTPPEGLWDEIARRLDQGRVERVARDAPAKARPGMRGMRRWFLSGSVVAVSVALGLWLILARAPEPVGFLDPRVAELLMESQSLEEAVNSRPAAPSAIRDVLLFRIAEVDIRLNDASLADSRGRAMEPLLRRRVALLHALVDLGYRPATRYNPALRPAVLNPALRPAALSGDDR
jgi:hypothetical protein